MNILLVEDDEVFTHAVKGYLTSAGYKVVSAENGKMAIYEMDKSEFDCVLSDVQMPVLNGLELAKWSRENHPNVPVILMTGYSDGLATSEALSKGATNLIYKPFSADEVLRAIRECAKPKVAAAGRQTFEGYARIPSRALVATAHAEFDLYLVVDNKLKKTVTRGEPYNPSNDVLKKHTHFYTESENLGLLIPINIMMTKAAVKNQRVDPEKKATMIQQSVDLLFEKFDSSGFDDRAFGDSMEFIKCYMESINDKGVWDLLNKAGSNSNYVRAFTMATTAVSTMVAQSRQMSLQDQYKIATAAMFHDLGLSQIDTSILTKAKPLMTAIERAQLEKHVEIGVKMLKQAQSVPDEILLIILQHHENGLGTGYPNRLKHEQIHPLARLLHVVDEFCTRVMKSPGHPGMPEDKAIAQMQQSKEYDFYFVESLKTILKSK